MSVGAGEFSSEGSLRNGRQSLELRVSEAGEVIDRHAQIAGDFKEW